MSHDAAPAVALPHSAAGSIRLRRMAADAWLRTRTRWRGTLRRSRALSELLGIVALTAHLLDRRETHRLRALLLAARRLQSRPGRAALRRALSPWLAAPRSTVWRERRIGWERYYAGFGGLDRAALTTSLLLKAPGPNGEKGVLYSSFEYNWMRLVAHHDAARVLDEYYLVGASSGAALDYAAYASLVGLSTDPIFIGVSNPAQLRELDVLGPTIEPLPMMASDWIDPGAYQPRPHAERTIDILMVANWLPLKRHWILFEALRRMDRRLRVVLIGRNAPGRTEREIRAEARAFGVRQDLELHTNVGIEQVIAHQCDARISAILSDREGSCVATAESLFADTPVAMMRDAHVGSKAYINRRTGILMGRRGVSRQLSALLERASSLDPRAWALANISCHSSSARLNAVLRERSERTGRPWTRDIAPLCWRYVPSYVDASDQRALEPAVAELRSRHGVELVRFVHRPAGALS